MDDNTYYINPMNGIIKSQRQIREEQMNQMLHNLGVSHLVIYETKTETPKPIINKTIKEPIMKRILNWMLNRIGDKGVHFSVCFIFSFIIALVTLLITGNYYASSFSGFMGGTGLGLGKEYGDSQAHGNYWSWADILADETGAIWGTAIANLIYYFFKIL